MPWVSPPDFVTGVVVQETDLDTLSGDLNYLLNGSALSNVVRDNAANYQTTSGSFVDVDATNLILTLNVSGGRAVVLASFVLAAENLSTAGAEVDIIVDSTTRLGHATHGLKRVTQNNNEPVTIVGVATGLSVGSHTFKLQYRSVTAGAISIIYANASSTGLTPGSVVVMTGWGN